MIRFSLFILLSFPLNSFSQYCNYTSTEEDATELCNLSGGVMYNSDRNAERALDKVLSVMGLSKTFVLKQCNDISNCIATSYNGVRYILYDKKFMDAIANKTNSWSQLSILAHEVGHHINGHSIDLVVYATGNVETPTLKESRQMELEADEFSGFIMYHLGASLDQAQSAIKLLSNNNDDSRSTHPSRHKRFAAIEKGYNKARSNSSNKGIYTKNNSSLTADEYFYKAMENRDKGETNLAIENFSKAISFGCEDMFQALWNRGMQYQKIKEYKLAYHDFKDAERYPAPYLEKEIMLYQLAFARVTSLGSIGGDAYYNYGDNMLEDINTVIELFPLLESVTDERILGMMYYTRGDIYITLYSYNKAVDAYESSIKYGYFVDGAFYFKLAMARIKTKRYNINKVLKELQIGCEKYNYAPSCKAYYEIK
jgi:hypothetical protein